MASEIRITVIEGEQIGQTLSAAFDRPVTIGRSSKADISLRDRSEHLSGRHFEVRREGGEVVIVNQGKNETLVDGKPLERLASRPVGVGTEVSVRRSVRFRFDSVGVEASPGDESPTGGTLATRATAATNSMCPTLTTGLAETQATRAATAAHASQVIDAASFSPVASSFPATRVSASVEAMAPMDDGPATGGDDGPTLGSRGEETVAMSMAGIAHSTVRPTGPSTDADSVTNDPERTRALGGTSSDPSSGTINVDFETLKQQELIRQQKAFYRRVLLSVGMGLFLALVGGVIWYRWPRAERFLSVPLVPGTEKRDYAHQVLKDRNDQKALVAFYPRDRRMRETALDNGGLEVSTFLGRDRDVSFWLRVTRREDPKELERSLEESAAHLKDEMTQKEQVSFLATPEWTGDGCCFLETEYPGASHDLRRGTRIYRTEYRLRRNGEERHGVLMLVRDRATVWKIERDVPEREWERGRIALRVNPNVEFFADYLENRWESPGVKAMRPDADLDDLFAQATAALQTHEPRPSEWPELARTLNTLVYRTLDAPADERKRALELLGRLHWFKEVAYHRCEADYWKQRNGGARNADGVAKASAEVRNQFGADKTERYCDLVGDLESWTCQKKK